MKITKDSYVTCEYELYTGKDKEEIVEKATPEAPLALIVGAGFLLEAFEKQLLCSKNLPTMLVTCIFSV